MLTAVRATLATLFGSSVDPNRYCPEALLSRDLSGKTCLITGGNSGFGKLVAKQLCGQGANVIIAGRRLEVCQAAAAEIGDSCTAMHVDLASLESVRTFAAAFLESHSSLDLLIENAAVCCVPDEPTADGFEPHLGINHYGHFLLRDLLEPALAAAAPSRVVVLGSSLHDRMFTQEPTELDLSEGICPARLGWPTGKTGQLNGWMAYSRSKLANVISARAAAPRLAAKGITCVSVHPGLDVSTGLFRLMPIGAKIMWMFSRSLGVQTTWQSIQTVLYCALEAAEDLEPGAFYSQHYQAGYRDGSVGGWPMKSPNPIVNDADAAERLERISRAAVGLKSRPLSPAMAEALAVEATPAMAEALM